MGLKASVKGGDSKKNDNVEIIPDGFQLCTLYGLADIGTQDGGNFGPKHKLNMAFEFPQQMRVFYEGDEAKPSAIFTDENMSMHEKSNLRKRFVQPMKGGKAMTDDEAADYDIADLLGKHFIATISHSPDGKWANIQSIIPLTEQNMGAVGLSQPMVEQVNSTYYYDSDLGYESENFATLPKFVREKIMNSAEGKAHQMAGGKFAEYVNTNKEGTTASKVAGPPSANSASGKLEMIDKTVSYEDYIAAGWTDQQLIDNGKAKIATPVAPPAPITNATPPPPVAPAPPTAPTPPVAPHVPVLVMNNPDDVAADWIANGWTQEQIISEGHGKLV